MLHSVGPHWLEDFPQFQEQETNWPFLEVPLNVLPPHSYPVAIATRWLTGALNSRFSCQEGQEELAGPELRSQVLGPTLSLPVLRYECLQLSALARAL